MLRSRLGSTPSPDFSAPGFARAAPVGGGQLGGDKAPAEGPSTLDLQLAAGDVELLLDEGLFARRILTRGL